MMWCVCTQYVYHIAGYFQGGNFHKFHTLRATMKVFFMKFQACPTHMLIQHSVKVFSTIRSFPSDPQKCSPSNVSCYTVYLPHHHARTQSKCDGYKYVGTYIHTQTTYSSAGNFWQRKLNLWISIKYREVSISLLWNARAIIIMYMDGSGMPKFHGENVINFVNFLP